MNEIQEVKAVQKIKAALVDEFRLFPSHATKFSLQRWLEEYNYDVDAVIPKLRWSLNTLEAVGARNMDTSSIESINHCIRNYTRAAPYFPGGLMSYDRDGNIVFMQPFGRLQPSRLIQCGKVSNLYKLLILEAYATHELVCAEEEKRKKRLGQIAIFDMSGFSRHSIYLPGIKIISGIFSTLQRTKEALEFLGNEWCSRLKVELGEENILPYWGGTMTARLPTGDIRMGGEPTQQVIDSMQPPEKVPYTDLKLIKVPARRCSIINANIEMQGQILKWYFTCAGGDVDYYIQKDGREVVPRFRLTTQFCPEFGELQCDEIGLYEICFDNGHSVLWSKTIAYKIDLVQC